MAVVVVRNLSVKTMALVLNDDKDKADARVST